MLAIGLAPAFAKKFPFDAAASVPAAQGQVETGRAKDDRTEVKISIEHLAPPEKLTPAQTVYLVWFQESGNAPVVQGQLRLDKKLKGKFKTTTNMKTFDVIITAESDVTLKAPSGQEVLRTAVEQ